MNWKFIYLHEIAFIFDYLKAIHWIAVIKIRPLNVLYKLVDHIRVIDTSATEG